MGYTTVKLPLIQFLLVLLISTSPSLYAENQQGKHSELKNKISSKRAELEDARQVSNKLRNEVLEAESELDRQSRLVHNTEQKINQLSTRLGKLYKQKEKLKEQTRQQKDALAQQMQALYTSGKQSHLRLLLKQDDPSDISRTVKYFEFMNQHRTRRIQEIKSRLTKIDQLQEEINNDKQQLTGLLEQQGKEKTKLKKAVEKYEIAYKSQRKTVYSKEKQLKTLKREEAQLRQVIARLQAREEKAEEKRQREEARRKKEEEQKRQQGRTAAKEKKPTGQLIERSTFIPDKPFSSLKGKLSWPVKGRITHRYGSARNERHKWKGVIITAAGGSKVQAVAPGKVEYSGRLKGYGYLIIISHDKNYRTLYAYNRSVFKKKGQLVKAGEVIAAVGNTGGNAQNGLYFEIRKGLSHQNPSHWCR